MAPLQDLACLATIPAAERDELARHLVPIRVAQGATIVREGANDRVMYIITRGEAAVVRSGLQVATLRAGEHFGELALITGRPRRATITALSELELLRLGEEAWSELQEHHPRVAFCVARAVLTTLGGQLAGMSDNVGILLRDRSLPPRATVEVRRTGETLFVPSGTPLADLLPRTADGHPVVAALVDRRATSLFAPITGECDIEPLTTAHWEGARIHRTSATLLLLEASMRRFPELQLRAAGSVGFAQRMVFEGPPPRPPAELARVLQEEVESICHSAALLREELWTLDEARDHFAEVGWADATGLLSTWRGPLVPIGSYGQVYALELGPFVPSASLLEGCGVIPDHGGLLLVYDVKGAKRRPFWAMTSPPPRRPSEPGAVASTEDLVTEAVAVSRQTAQMTEEQERWLGTLDITSLGHFNRAVIDGDVSQLIRVSEGFQEKALGQIADRIRDLRNDVRVVCVAGPSSSGKTTFIKRLRVQLQVNGINPIGLSLDDYYVDREATPKDEHGEWDFESLEAIHVELLRQHLELMLAGSPVRTARYDFPTGRSHPSGGPEIHLERRDILLVEGIHGLNPLLFSNVPEASVYRIFICPLAQLPFDRVSRVHASDLRLIRRIVRDRRGRGHDAAATILRWPAVRAGERRHIFPFQAAADTVFDSSLIYELSVLKVFAERYLLEVPTEHPAQTTAFRILQLLDHCVPIYPDHVPPTSILREFIGGSGFEY